MQPPTPLEALREAFPFKRTPMNCGDGGVAFMNFIGFVSARSPIAKSIRDSFRQLTGITADAPMSASKEEVGQFIDWLIETHWGEEPAPVHHDRDTPAAFAQA